MTLPIERETPSTLRRLHGEIEEAVRARLSHPERWILFGVLACAFGVRAWNLSANLPYAVGVDEPAIVDRGLRILQTGDWNPHIFDYPTLVIYLQALVTAVCFLFGASHARWSSLQTIDITAVYETGRFVAALIGTATVWLTYRLGKDLDSRTLGLVAAAELAVFPMHVRESHYILTDVPTTALVAFTLLLALRAGRRRTVLAYWWAGAAAGLSAAAKYNGIAVAPVVALVWLIHERSARDRGQKAWAGIAAAGLAFLLAVPYSILDLPGFLNGFGAQLARFSRPSGDVPPWRTYLIHLSLAWRYWVPTAALGTAIVVYRRRLTQWAVPILFVGLYYYVLATHSVVFGRYALPLLPGVCLLAAVPVVELGRVGKQRLQHPATGPVLTGLGALVMVAIFGTTTVDWLVQFREADTRTMTARWMKAAIPVGSRIALAGRGPSYLDRAGFAVVDSQDRATEQAVDSYAAAGVEFIVLATQSQAELSPFGSLLDRGNVLFSVDPSSNHWGPFVRIVRPSRP
jgi:4-amino-4-deoxy-L-arabinose transferase-like glycosyltransferase